ncbi:SDR family oxidoreductase [Roseospira goensis]|uniref:NAD(P)-dependent dehydrogenase (Short-subunit alcohol dehydrogenase family) n=1 Tax=Roseospira goensis TaxID=391922 RepID=A0A7W6WJG4_9PROT|nr:SDR family oxidoreductase [Roseospira goensis]MBB4285181.1 NAD(P)-dependent dehydrogenase (short-subunit alcohol dehydrogenase family) [Roseospira goensis]
MSGPPSSIPSPLPSPSATPAGEAPDLARQALVTGGSAGIGRAIVDRLAADGYRVLNLDRDPVPDPPPGVETVAVDFADPAAAEAVLAEVTATRSFGLLVANVGQCINASLDETAWTDLRRLADVNLNSAILAARATVPAMRQAGSGRIVGIASRAALGKPNRTAYAATKAGMIGLVRTWAQELAPHGITCNAVAPGPIATALFRASNPPDAPQTRRLMEAIPLGRLGEPAEVARAVAFFAAPEAGFITGQTLYVCGGASLGAMA